MRFLICLIFLKGVFNMGTFTQTSITGDNSISLSSCEGNVTINGKTYTGNHITVDGDNVIVDGKVQDEIPAKNIIVNVTGDVGCIEGNPKVVTCGNVSGDVTITSGRLTCKDVTGDVTASSGSVRCDTVKGGVRTSSGSVKCTGSIKGSVKTSSGSVFN
jgi:hypothetical protein